MITRKIFTAAAAAVAVAVIIITANCANPANESGAHFSFVVADVGQGLAQFAVMNNETVVIDVGLPAQHTAWRAAYNGLGRPAVKTMIISHSDNDHYGGLRHLDANLNWDGSIITTPHEDTAKLRAAAAPHWRSRITFSFIARGDTLRFFNNAVEMICLWPPVEIDAPLPLEWVHRNRYSLVLSIRHGNTRALVTSDIDANAMGRLAVTSGHELRSDILSVPHHGSGGSVNHLFFSYVGAGASVISCGAQNSYGHPHPSMIDALTYQGSHIYYTFIDHTVTFTSNGYYYARRGR